MSTRTTSLLASAALVVGLVAGAFFMSRFYQGRMSQFAAESAAAALGSTHSKLQRIREGNTNAAIELLELELDGCMLALDSMLAALPHRGRSTNSIRLLDRARAYRVAHPREPAVDGTREKSM